MSVAQKAGAMEERKVETRVLSSVASSVALMVAWTAGKKAIWWADLKAGVKVEQRADWMVV